MKHYTTNCHHHNYSNFNSDCFCSGLGYVIGEDVSYFSMPARKLEIHFMVAFGFGADYCGEYNSPHNISFEMKIA